MKTLFCKLPTAYRLLPTAYRLLPTAYCLLPIAYCLLPIAYCLLLNACSSTKPAVTTPSKILVYSKTTGFRHDCIPSGIEAIKKLGTDNGFLTDFTEDSTQFNSANLKNYKAVIFLCTTHNVLSDSGRAAFKSYIEAGNGFVGIHAATDTEYGWAWYGKLVGAYFISHPAGQPLAKINVVDNTNIATQGLPAVWERKDEWYNFKQVNPDNHILLNLDEKSYKGGVMGAKHPIAWYHDYDGGRAFYTGLGHTKDSYIEPLFLQHLMGGISYALGIKATATVKSN